MRVQCEWGGCRLGGGRFGEGGGGDRGSREEQVCVWGGAETLNNLTTYGPHLEFRTPFGFWAPPKGFSPPHTRL